MQRDSILKVEGVIYKITNLINNKIYIGQTRQRPIERWQSHLQESAKLDKSRKSYLHSSIHKYGFDNFKFEIIFTIKAKDVNNLSVLLDALEVFYISKFKTIDPKFGYNLTSGGSKKFIISEETREKLRISHLGYEWSEESKQKLSKTIKGRKHSDQTKQKISIAHMGKKKPQSEDHKQKSRNNIVTYNKTRTGSHINELIKLKSALTQQTYRYWICDITGKELIECYSQQQIVKYINTTQRNISSYFNNNSACTSIKGYLLKRLKLTPEMDRSFQKIYIPDSQIIPLPKLQQSWFCNNVYECVNIDTGEITKFNSLQNMAEFFGVKEGTLSRIIKQGKDYKGFSLKKSKLINFDKTITII